MCTSIKGVFKDAQSYQGTREGACAEDHVQYISCAKRYLSVTRSNRWATPCSSLAVPAQGVSELVRRQWSCTERSTCRGSAGALGAKSLSLSFRNHHAGMEGISRNVFALTLQYCPDCSSPGAVVHVFTGNCRACLIESSVFARLIVGAVQSLARILAGRRDGCRRDCGTLALVFAP